MGKVMPCFLHSDESKMASKESPPDAGKLALSLIADIGRPRTVQMALRVIRCNSAEIGLVVV